MTRVEGERKRLRHHLDRLRVMVDSMSMSVEANFPPGVDAAQALTQEATSFAMTIAKLDAYMRAEDDADE